MRTFITSVVFMAFFSGWLRAEGYKEQRTGVEFPDTVAGFKRGRVSPYEAEPGKAGVAIEYKSHDAEATVYVRTAGKDSLKTSAEFLKESLAAVRVLEAQGKYSNVKIYESAPEKERPGWSSGAFTSGSTTIFLCHSSTARSNPLICSKSVQLPQPNDDVQSFTKSMQELMDKVSKRP